jgi:TPR repeat protein
MRTRLALSCALFCALASPLALAHDPNSPSSDTFAALLKSLNKMTRADLAVITQRAQARDPRSEMMLGILYRDGILVPRDHAAYLQWIKLSADHGYAAAETELGSDYAFNAKPAEAIAWFEKALAQDNVDAEFNLGLIYAKGEDTPEHHSNMLKAVPYFRKAATQNHPAAQYILALAYHEGTGIERDEEQCKKWMIASAEQGYGKAQFSVAARYYLVSDYKNAFLWFKRAADQKHSRAELNVATMYFVGQGTRKDLQQALYWNQRAAEHGESSALRMIGTMYASGTGVAKDLVTSYAYLLAAAESGNQQASLDAAKLAGLLSDIEKAQANRRISELAIHKAKPIETGTLAASQP